MRQRKYEKVGETNSQMNISRRQKTKGNEEENRKDVGNEHMSSQESYTLREYYDHSMCVCVSVSVCVTVGGVFMNYHTVYL